MFQVPTHCLCCFGSFLDHPSEPDSSELNGMARDKHTAFHRLLKYSRYLRLWILVPIPNSFPIKVAPLPFYSHIACVTLRCDALHVLFFFFYFQVFYIVFFKWFFSRINAEFCLWGGSDKSTDTRRYDIAMHYYIFFFFKIIIVLKFKPLLRCAYVRYFNLYPESLDAETGQMRYMSDTA